MADGQTEEGYVNEHFRKASQQALDQLGKTPDDIPFDEILDWTEIARGSSGNILSKIFMRQPDEEGKQYNSINFVFFFGELLQQKLFGFIEELEFDGDILELPDNNLEFWVYGEEGPWDEEE